MLILIAESKTMSGCDSPVASEVYNTHRPSLESYAANIMDGLRGMSVDELAKKVKISDALARRLATMIYDFPEKSTGGTAINAFTGVVFRAFDYPTLSDDAKACANSAVRIISSLYGWLRPDDIVKAYRFDFTTPLAPGGLSMRQYLRKAVTDCVERWLDDNACHEVLNLLPTDAAQCIDWKRVKARVVKADFKEMVDGTTLRTPTADKLKTLRGKLLRLIVSQGIDKVDDVIALRSDDFIADSEASGDGSIIFLTD